MCNNRVSLPPLPTQKTYIHAPVLNMIIKYLYTFI